jgi:glycosyltransferase involved in cell wall biosynthesis
MTAPEDAADRRLDPITDASMSEHPSPEASSGSSESSRAPRRVGLLDQGDRTWFAGVNHLHTLARSIDLLPEGPSWTLLHRGGETAPMHEAFLERLARSRTRGSSARFDGWSRPSLRSRLGALRRGRIARGLSAQIARLRIDALYPLHFAPPWELPVPWAAWIPDFQHCVLPQHFSDEERAARDRRFIDMLERAPLTVVSSEASKQDGIRAYGEIARKLEVLPFASLNDALWSADDQTAALDRLGVPKRFLLFPSQAWPHKGHATLAAALAKVPEARLVTTGFRPDDPRLGARAREAFESAKVADRVAMLGLIPRGDLAALLRSAAAVVQPSTFEGWSYLVEDAIAAGRPLVLSDLPVHREQRPETCVPVEWFEPGSVDGLAEAIARAWHAKAPRHDPQQEAQGRANAESRGRACGEKLVRILGAASARSSSNSSGIRSEGRAP